MPCASADGRRSDSETSCPNSHFLTKGPRGIIAHADETNPPTHVLPPASAGALCERPLPHGARDAGGITYATGGFGSSSHLAIALFSFLSGAKFNHVPYKGAAPALARAELVASRLDGMRSHLT